MSARKSMAKLSRTEVPGANPMIAPTRIPSFISGDILCQPLDELDDLLVVPPASEDVCDEAGMVAGLTADIIDAKSSHDHLCPKDTEVALSISRSAFVDRSSNFCHAIDIMHKCINVN